MYVCMYVHTYLHTYIHTYKCICIYYTHTKPIHTALLGQCAVVLLLQSNNDDNKVRLAHVIGRLTIRAQ